MSAECSVASSDMSKRLEVWFEFIYYLFDSILISLIQNNFYVTESNVHRNHLFYFRHDVWQVISKPHLRNIKHCMFEKLDPETVRKMLTSGSPGCGQLRLLPKSTGARPIINLRRRYVTQGEARRFRGQSINGRLMPVFSMLNYEKERHPCQLSSALFSVDELHHRLKRFRQEVFASKPDAKLYFVKVDVQSCFDSIPQTEIIRMMKSLTSESRYRVYRHAEMKPVDSVSGKWSRIAKRFVSDAVAADDARDAFARTVGTVARHKKRTVFVGLGNDQIWDAKKLNHMLEDHITRNLVKIGKIYYQQKDGIPQGSILSTLLCSFFYGQFEQECLGFLNGGQSLLLRLIDDFLLITTDKNAGVRFFRTMTDGNSKYGVIVNPRKSVTNFDLFVQGTQIAQPSLTDQFPYCGMLIHTRTLEISKDRSRSQHDIGNNLTVESCRTPGQSFHRKILASLKIQLHAMLLDTSSNTLPRVMSNLYECFVETAMKIHRYLSAFSRRNQIRSAVVVYTLESLLRLATSLVKAKHTKAVDDYECMLTGAQVNWLYAAAIESVFGKKQSQYATVLAWVEGVKSRSRSCMRLEDRMLEQVARQGSNAMAHYRY